MTEFSLESFVGVYQVKISLLGTHSMANKIRDILPPEEFIPTPQEMEKPQIEEQEEKKEELPKKIKVNWVWILVLLFLIIAAVTGFKILKVEVKIWPERETVEVRTNITLDTGVKEPDFENEIIPGYFFETEETISETFSSSGETLKRTEGIIRLYNEYTTKSENWLAGTRFVSSEGKLFKSKNRILVPGAEIKDGKMTASYVDVLVEAAEPGEEYNIGPSHFSIIAYKGTPKYTKYYGESFEAMKGGGDSFKVTAQDIENAQSSLIDKVKDKAITALESKITDEFIFLEDVLDTEIIEISSLAQEGDILEKFNSRVTIKVITIVFKKEQVKNFAKEFISSGIPASAKKLLYEKSLNIDYTPQVVNFESGKVIVALNLSVIVYPDIDLQSLKKELSGKSLTEAESLLGQQAEFRGEVKPWPFWAFWVKSMPEDLNKIEIEYPIID